MERQRAAATYSGRQRWKRRNRNRPEASRPEDRRNQSRPQRRRKANVQNSIEDQLKRQRQKKLTEEQIGTQQEGGESSEPRAAIMGNYRYDSTRNAYFPKEDVPQHASSATRATLTKKPERKQHYHVSPLQSYYFQSECSVSSRYRYRLRSEWAGRLLFASLALSERPVFPSRPNDLTCKQNLPVTSKTFDVGCGDSGNPYLATVTGTKVDLRRSLRVPSSDLQNGSSLNFRYPVCTMKAFSIDAHNIDRTSVAVLGMCDHVGSILSWFKDGSFLRPVSLPHPINAFCWNRQDDTFVLGGQKLPCIWHCTTNAVRPCKNLKGFSKSEVLCMESITPECPSTQILFGHRNGQITLWDSRCSSTPTSTHKSTTDTFGSVTDMTTLNQHHVLAKGLFGDCRLYDIRRLTSQIWNLSYDSVDTAMSSRCCSGVAVDPAQTLALSPFIDDSSKEACLGVWSLVSGNLVGTKQLTNTTAGQLPYCELSKTVTTAWVPTHVQDASPPRTPRGFQRSSRDFGLWVKCRRPCQGEWESFHQIRMVKAEGFAS